MMSLRLKAIGRILVNKDEIIRIGIDGERLGEERKKRIEIVVGRGRENLPPVSFRSLFVESWSIVESGIRPGLRAKGWVGPGAGHYPDLSILWPAGQTGLS